MNDSSKDLLLIGSFARATRLSLKALRLYDQLGILVPRSIDPGSGYRSYHVDQLHQARLIRMMRQMDMPLATIRQVLAVTPTHAEQIVREYWRTMEARVEQARRMVHDVIAYLHQEDPMALDVNVRTVPSQPMVSITRRVKVDQLDQTIRDSLATLSALVKEQGGSVEGSPLGIYHGPINNDEDGPIEVCMPVKAAITGSSDVQAGELPGGQVASVVLTGAQCQFPAVLEGYDTTHDWITKNGYQPEGSPREIWHSMPWEGEHMEIAWPFRAAGG